MGIPLFTNQAATTLMVGMENSSQTTIVIQPTDVSLFPTLAPGSTDYFVITLVNQNNSNLYEIVRVTATNGNVWTIVRGQEGTTQQVFNQGDYAQLRLTAAQIQYFQTAQFTSQEEYQTATAGQTVFNLGSFYYQPGTDNLAVFVNGVKQVVNVNYEETSTNSVTFISRSFPTRKQTITATAGQTIFNLTNFLYSPGSGNLVVSVDGVAQIPGSSYTETNTSTITFSTGLHVGALVEFNIDTNVNNGSVLNAGDIVEFITNSALGAGNFPATEVSIADAGHYYTSDNVEGALQEVGADIQSINTQIGDLNATQIAYTYPAVGAASQTVEQRLAQYVSVKDFGAVGNGTTDDTSAIQAAIDSLDATGGVVYFPQGVYKTTSALTLSKPIRLQGTSPECSVIYATSCNGVVINNNFCSIVGIEIQSTGTTKTYTGVRVAGVLGTPVGFVNVESSLFTNWAVAIQLEWATGSTITNSEITNCIVGIKGVGQCLNTRISDMYIVVDGSANSACISNVLSTGPQGEGMMITNSLLYGGQFCIKSEQYLSLTVTNCVIDQSVQYAVYLGTVLHCHFSNNWIVGSFIQEDQASTYDANISVIGNTIVSDTASEYLYIGANVRKWVIQGNNFSYHLGHSIVCATTSAQIVIDGNTFANGSALSTIQANGTDIVITNNVGDVSTATVSGYRHAEFNNSQFFTTYNTNAPISGTWKIGDRVYNSVPAVGQPKSWVCTVAGTPGTWVSEGNL